MTGHAFKADVIDQVYQLNQEISRLSKKVTQEKLSLKQIHKLSEEAIDLLRLAREVSKVASTVFAFQNVIVDGEKLFLKIEDLKEKRRREDRKKIVELRAIDSKIEDFVFDVFYQTPEQNETSLVSLYQSLKTFAKLNRNLSFYLDHAIDSSFDRLIDIDFLLKYPIAMELDKGSYEENFIHLVEDVKEGFLKDKNRGQLLFMQLSSKQKEGIYRSAAKLKNSSDGKKTFHDDMTDFERASSVQLYLDDLGALLNIVKTLIYKDESKAFYVLDQFGPKIQSEVDRFYKEISKSVSDEKEALVQAIIAVVENQIIG